MSTFHEIKYLGNDKALVTDIRTGGTLHLSCDPDSLGEQSVMVDFINELRESLWEKKDLLLEIKGENKIYFKEWILLEGHVSIQDVDLVNTDLKNVDLCNVNVKGFEDASIKFSTIKDVTFEYSGKDLVVDYCDQDVKQNVNKSVYGVNTLFRHNNVRSMGDF